MSLLGILVILAVILGVQLALALAGLAGGFLCGLIPWVCRRTRGTKWLMWSTLSGLVGGWLGALVTLLALPLVPEGHRPEAPVSLCVALFCGAGSRILVARTAIPRRAHEVSH